MCSNISKASIGILLKQTQTFWKLISVCMVDGNKVYLLFVCFLETCDFHYILRMDIILLTLVHFFKVIIDMRYHSTAR